MNSVEGEATQAKPGFWKPPGLTGIFCLGIFLLTLFGQNLHNIINIFPDSDSCWIIRTGQWILAHGAIPAHNPLAGGYPDLARVPIVCYQWLFEVLLGLGFNCAGLQGVTLIVATISVLTFALLIRWLYARGFRGVPTILTSILFALLVLKPFVVARPALVTFLFTALTLWLWERRLPLKKLWLIFPALFVLWANMHLGVTAGLLVLGVLSIEAAWQTKNKQYLWLWAACLLATLINPYGWELYHYFARLADSPFMNSHIFELGSPHFNTFPMAVVYFTVVVLSFAFTLDDPRIRNGERWLLLIGFALGLYSQRHLFLLGIFELPFLCCIVDRLIQNPVGQMLGDLFTVLGLSFSGFTREEENPWLWIAVYMVIGAFLAQGRTFQTEFQSMKPLSGTLAYLKTHRLPEPMLTNELWGSDLLWEGDNRGLLDSRMDMYGDARVRDLYGALNLEKGWPKLYERYKVRYALLPADELQANTLEHCEGWHRLYGDKTAILLERPDMNASASAAGQ